MQSKPSQRIPPPTPAIALGPEHLEACESLDQLALGGLWSRAQWRAELEAPDHLVMGVCEREQLVALACGQAIVDDVHITAVAVHPQCRRQGIGQGLLRSLLEAARVQGCRRATLEVDSCNTAAVTLYSRLGFTTEGVRRAYYRSGGDALIQWCDL